jgi:uncharacterized membrane protein YdjX (TVP38/TMEM64 family)
VNKRRWAWFCILALVCLGVAGAVWALLPVKQTLAEFLEPAREKLGEFLEWARDHRVSGAIILSLAYVLACILAIPGSLLTLGGGFALGLVVGFVAVFFGANVGALAAFLLGRTLARGWIEKKVAASPKFQAIDQAVGAQGFKMVLLLRLSPVFPFSILNYALGLTRVSFRDYVLANLLGMLPGILMYVYLGSLISNVAELFTGKRQQGPAEQALFYVGLAATVIVTLWITWIARRALATAVPATPANESGPPQGEGHG